MDRCAHTIGFGIQCPGTATMGGFFCAEHHGPTREAEQPQGGEDPKQCWRTPRVGGRHVVREFALNHDVAADARNALVPSFWSRENSALDRWWPIELRIWNNPPFRIAEAFAAPQLKHMEHGGVSAMLVLDRGAQWLEAVRRQARWWLFDGRVEYEPAPELAGQKTGGVTFASVLMAFDRTKEPGFMGWRDPKTFEWVFDRRGRSLR